MEVEIQRGRKRRGEKKGDCMTTFGNHRANHSKNLHLPIAASTTAIRFLLSHFAKIWYTRRNEPNELSNNEATITARV